MKEKIVNEMRFYSEETEEPLERIAELTGHSYKIVWTTVSKLYTPEQRKARKIKNYAKSKTGEKNPMYQKCRETHHGWIGGEVSDGKGYTMVIKPDWYTGRKGSKYVFKHSVVFCEALGITEIPKGFIVHHIDENKTNNIIHNLALMTSSGHSRLHSMRKRVTTISKESREYIPEAHDNRCERAVDDMV